MTAPFKLPVRLADGEFLVDADCELISRLDSATPDEAAFIVKAINAYPLLVELHSTLKHVAGLPLASREILDRIDAII